MESNNLICWLIQSQTCSSFSVTWRHPKHENVAVSVRVWGSRCPQGFSACPLPTAQSGFSVPSFKCQRSAPTGRPALPHGSQNPRRVSCHRHGPKNGMASLQHSVPHCLHRPRPSSRLLCMGCGSELPVPEQEHLQKVNLCLEAAAPKEMQHRSRSQGLSVGQDGSC